MTRIVHVRICHKNILTIKINWINLRQSIKFKIKIKSIKISKTKIRQIIENSSIICPYFYVYSIMDCFAC